MNLDEISEKAVLLKDSYVRLNGVIANRLGLGMTVDKYLDDAYIMYDLIYAVDCSFLAYKDSHFDTLFELMDRVLLRCTDIGSTTTISQKTIVPSSTQYIYYDSNDSYSEYTGTGTVETVSDGITSIRKRLYGGYLYRDITLTPIGFNGTEGIDWNWFERILLASTSIRNGVRNGCWYIDQTLTVTGFSGVIGADWENISNQCGSNTYPVWRDGVREGKYVVDHALDAVGFGGKEGVNWEKIL